MDLMDAAADVPVDQGDPVKGPAEDSDRLEPERVMVAGQELWIFAESPALFATMLQDIRSAQRRVWIECYIFLNDSVGRAVADALVERARAGLDVRVLYDAVGSQATPQSFFEEMSKAGVQVHAFHTLWEAARHLSLIKFFRTMNRRDHRKLTVIDDRIGYFGGMNIVHQGELPAAKEIKRLPMSAGWRDLHVRLYGSKQRELARSFERSWRQAHGMKGQRRRRFKERDRVPTVREIAAESGDEYIRFLDAGLNSRKRRLGAVFRNLIRGASRSVLLSMAYFIPSGRVLAGIRRAARRGVRVRVVVPAVSDVKLVYFATRYLYDRLLKMGVELYERQDCMLHSKVMVVDDRWVVVGSSNLDPRSLLINLEFVAIIRSIKMAAKVTSICEHEIAHSQHVTHDAYATRRWWQRCVDRIAYSFRRWL
jgi:cardiolipin synthase A/B